MSTIICVGTGLYRVVWTKDRRMVRLCEKLLHGLPVNHRSGRYRYTLFCDGFGFVLSRKDLSLPVWAQVWVDVCEVERVS